MNRLAHNALKIARGAGSVIGCTEILRNACFSEATMRSAQVILEIEFWSGRGADRLVGIQALIHARIQEAEEHIAHLREDLDKWVAKDEAHRSKS